MFDVASIELLVNNHGTAHERKVWQTLKAHCTQPTGVQQANTAICPHHKVGSVCSVNDSSDNCDRLPCKAVAFKRQ
jgi:hypothetical protein